MSNHQKKSAEKFHYMIREMTLNLFSFFFFVTVKNQQFSYCMVNTFLSLILTSLSTRSQMASMLIKSQDYIKEEKNTCVRNKIMPFKMPQSNIWSAGTWPKISRHDPQLRCSRASQYPPMYRYVPLSLSFTNHRGFQPLS